MKRLLTILSLTALALHGPPAWADTWSGSTPGTGVFHAPTVTNGAGGSSAIDFFYRSDGSPDWRICTSPWGYATTYFDAPCEQFQRGETFGGAYQKPTSLGQAGWLSADWYTYTTAESYGIDDRLFGVTYLSADRQRLAQSLTRTVIATDRPRPMAEFQPWHSRIYWNPAEPGTGVTLDFQGSSVFIGFFGYASSGQAEWRIATGGMITQTMASLPFQRCTEGEGCVSEGTVTVRLLAVVTDAGTSNEIDVTYPNGVTKRYQQY